MSRTIPLLAATAVVLLAIRPTAAITIDTVTVGNPGNANNSLNGLGAVGYSFSMGKFEVTQGQYAAFLNAVAASDPYGLYNSFMTSHVADRGISRSGASRNYHYFAINPNHPIADVTWGDAARFANWMANGQPTGLEDATTTERGSYTLDGAITDAALQLVQRNPGATWVIPTVDEWIKAGYYDAATNSYHLYATSTDTPPTSAPPGNTPNTANFLDPVTGYAVTGSTTFELVNYLTDVGAYTASASPYGTFDQGDNVREWTETTRSTNWRMVSNAEWDATLSYTTATSFSEIKPSDYSTVHPGFRLALIPEPSTAILAFLGLAGFNLCGRRLTRLR